ncbi:MAG: AmmeMemoRadiSam system protein A [Spirochaetales bacterium]|jgi:AmmeMemoRadiSam system protein A|nr:AmmeMemoRadiSam system protein A [Spirochaetales bacterium]
MDLELSADEKKILLHSVRETLVAKLDGRVAVYMAPTALLSDSSYGAFVTLRGGLGDLRGCIGNLSGRGKALCELVKEMALASAFEDPRFPPVRKEEMERISIEISVLSEFEEAAAADVIPGKHGILIRRSYHSGILLPQVATEQGWGREQFLSHGCLKAGLPPESWRQKDTRISIFTALVFHE